MLSFHFQFPSAMNSKQQVQILEKPHD
uniref:Uncharacterized protein n=1 Tax=Rhizophora mucronata TaxID=61149 RepID=A0A2P2Q804_RHIMU